MTDPRDPQDMTGELSELRALVADLDGSAPEWEQPPAGLWDRIAAEAAVPVGDSDPAANEPGGTVTPLRPRRRALPWVAGAAAAAVVLVLGVVAVFGGSDPAPTVVAAAALDRLGPIGSGQAELVEVDGSLVLQLDTADLDPGDGFLEVWLIDPEVTRLVSLGPMRADGTYDVPDGLDPAEFPIVDISAEPLDGDPTHSGHSLLRGTLTF